MTVVTHQRTWPNGVSYSQSYVMYDHQQLKEINRLTRLKAGPYAPMSWPECENTCTSCKTFVSLGSLATAIVFFIYAPGSGKVMGKDCPLILNMTGLFFIAIFVGVAFKSCIYDSHCKKTEASVELLPDA